MSFETKLVHAAVVFLLASLGAGTASALENVRFNQASVEDGLSQGSAQAIAQDREGFIWIGTQQGLNRYDGYEFVTYFHDPADEHSLSHDWIWALHVAADGGLWVGTKDGGLDRFDPATARVERHSFPAGTDGVRPDVRAIVSDGDGRIWAGSDGGGVIRLDPSSGRTRQFLADAGPSDGSVPTAASDPSALSSNRVKALHVDASGYIWVGTDGGGLNRIDPVRESVTRIALSGELDARVRSIVSDGRGLLWIGTNEHGLYLLDPETGVTRRYLHADDQAGSLSSDSIRALFVDSSLQLWVGTHSHGVNRLDPAGESFTHIRHEPANSRSLSDDHATAIFEDRGGVIWIGTHDGLNTWNPLTGAFSTFRRYEDAPGSLSSNMAQAFARNADGRLLVGTSGGGVDAVDLTTGYAERIDLVEGRTALSDDRVFSLVARPNGEIWAGTRAGGLNHFDPVSGRWSVYRNDPEDPGSLSFDGVTSLHEDDDGTLWVGTYLGGLNRFDETSGTFAHFRHDPDDPQSLCSDRVVAIMRGHAGRLWIGTHGGGLCWLDPATGTFTAVRHDPAAAESLSSNDAWAFVEDPAGNLWVGTSDGGLNLWRAADRDAGVVRFTHIGERAGLASPIVYGLLADARGRIWAAGNRGITRVDGATLKTRQYTALDGLQGNEFNFGAAYRSATGQLFFGGTQGFTGFFPERIGINANPPRVALTRFQRNYETESIERRTNEDGALVLKHTDQHVTFEYAGLDFTSPQANRYEHRLDGFDTGWVSDDGRHRVTYTNLKPGNYELRVRASNNDGVWSVDELTVPIVMRPAPWATWWAQSAYVLALVLSLYLVWRLHDRKLARVAEMNRVQASLIHEITERQTREAELMRTRRRAQRYLDVVEVIILALDRDGTVTLVNQKGVRVLGYPEEEIIGRNFYDWFVPDEYADEVRDRFEHVDQYAYSESPVKPKEGSERMIAWHTITTPPVDDEGEPGGLLISGTDVTQIRNLEQQLRDAQKMEALGTLARGVAHDFNNILSSILGYAELSMSQLHDTDKVAEYLEKLESSVGRARDLIARILAFGRGGGQAPRPVRVQDAAVEALELLKPVLPANIRVEDCLELDAGAVLADPTQLVQVVLNLCTNAAQALNESGGVLRVEVCGHHVGIEEARSSAVLVPGPHVRLSVIDNGPGMDDFTLSRIFDPFFTTRTRDEGTGLGLAVVHGIVTQLHGTVRVYSEPGEGARFDVFLPCSGEAIPAPIEPAGSSDEGVVGSGTVLFVDDEPAVRAIGEEALTRMGYRVLTAGDGAAALEIFETAADEIDVVVTDQTMPAMLGHKLAERLKARRDVPVVLMSGAGRPVTDAVDVFVEKPFSLAALGRAVRSVQIQKPA